MTPAIPIRNIYFLLLYAWRRLAEGQLVDVGSLSDTSLANLFARVLCSGTRHLMRRGLDRGYLSIEEDTSCLRGRIDFSTSARRLLLQVGRARCAFDELSYDVLHNQILRSTLERLAQANELAPELRADIHRLLKQFHAITSIKVDRLAFRKLQFHRNNGFYRFLMQVCEMIHAHLLPDEQAGGYRFRDFIRDEQVMASVFQDFVFNFFRLEQSKYSVCSDTLSWDVTSADERALRYLPCMRTDITLRAPHRTIVIDTKYYKETLSTYFGKASIHSGHLYQLCTYLRALERHTGPDATATGILLYPTVSHDLRLQYQLHGHEVHIWTLDLAQDWQAIAANLLSICHSFV